MFESIFNYIIDKKEIAKEDDIKNAQVLFMKYLRPAQNFIDKMTEKELYDFKIGKLGGGGPKGIFSELINVIGEVYNDFEEDRRKNKEQEETFDNIFNSLIENGENDEIEAKESFFLNTKKLKDTGIFEKNDKMTLDIIRTITAMGNGIGGNIILGILDPQNNKNNNKWENLGLEPSDLNKSFKYSDKSASYEKYRKAIIDKIRDETEQYFINQIDVKVVGNSRNPSAIIEIKQISKERLDALKWIEVNNVVYQRIGDSTVPLKSQNQKIHQQKLMQKLYPKTNNSQSFISLISITDKKALEKKLPKHCPKCRNVVVNTIEDAEYKFGFRRVNDKLIFQSYCISCR